MLKIANYNEQTASVMKLKQVMLEFFARRYKSQELDMINGFWSGASL
jgi:hypothetical protein